MTNTLFAQVVPLLVAMAVPVGMIKAIRYLLAGRPVVHSLLMIMTWGATFFLVLSLAVSLKSFLIDLPDTYFTYQPSKDFSSWMHLVLGLLFIVVGVKKLRHSLRQESTPAVQQSVPVTAFSIIKTTIHSAVFIEKRSDYAFYHAHTYQKRNSFSAFIGGIRDNCIYLDDMDSNSVVCICTSRA